MTSTPSTSAIGNMPRPFVYISAEDIFRPIVPARYIETKREAERGIEEMMTSGTEFRGVYIRPSACCVLSSSSRPRVLIPILFASGSSLHHLEQLPMMCGHPRFVISCTDVRLWDCCANSVVNFAAILQV